MTTESVHVIVAPEGIASALDIKLDFVSIVMGSMTVSSALLFRGSIETSKFLDAAQSTANACPYLYGMMKYFSDPPAVHVLPRVDAAVEGSKDANGFLVVEVDDAHAEEDFDTTDATVARRVNAFLPVKVHEKMVNFSAAMTSLDGLPIAAFRVTRYKGHFVLGYRLNHMFFDQGGLVSLLDTLARAYREGERALAGELLPKFVPRATNVAASRQFASMEEFLAGAPKGYNSDPIDYTKLDFAPPTHELSAKVDRAHLEQLRRSASSPASPGSVTLSSNDFIHAALLQVLAEANDLSSDDAKVTSETPIRIMYAHNMRKPLGLPFHTHGDYVRVEQTKVLLSQVSAAKGVSLREIAKINRDQLEEHSRDMDAYEKELMWFRDFRQFVRQGFPNTDFVSDPLAIVCTNWSSFPYEGIRFDAASGEEDAGAASGPLTLLLESPPIMGLGGGFVRVGFDYEGNERVLVVNIVTRHEKVVAAFKHVVETSGLFRDLAILK